MSKIIVKKSKILFERDNGNEMYDIFLAAKIIQKSKPNKTVIGSKLLDNGDVEVVYKDKE